MRSTYKIVFLGSSNVGKTTLMSQYLHQEVEQSYGPTVGLDFVSTTITISGHKIRLQLWDTAGQERFNSIIPNYTRNSFLTIVVFDMKEPKSFEKIDHWINNLVRINDSGHKIKVLIVGNKMDLVDQETHAMYRELGSSKASEHNGVYVEACAMKYEGIGELVKAVTGLIQNDLESSAQEEENIIKTSESIGFTKRNSCC